MRSLPYSILFFLLLALASNAVGQVPGDIAIGKRSGSLVFPPKELTVSEVKNLPRSETYGKISVAGVVTVVLDGTFVVQDADAAILCIATNAMCQGILGMKVHVEGTVREVNLERTFLAARLTSEPALEWPDAAEMRGEMFARRDLLWRRVKIKGTIDDFWKSNQRLRMLFYDRLWSIPVVDRVEAQNLLIPILPCDVELEGVLAIEYDGKSNSSKLVIWRTEKDPWKVTQPIYEVPDTIQQLPISQLVLSEFGSLPPVVQTQGTVQRIDERDLWISDERGGLCARLRPSNPSAIGVGDVVQLEGIIQQKETHRVLQIRHVLSIDHHSNKHGAPTRIVGDDLHNPLNFGRLVECKGTFQHCVYDKDATDLIFRVDRSLVAVRMGQATPRYMLDSALAGSLFRLRGIVLPIDRSSEVIDGRLELRNASDLEQLSSPPLSLRATLPLGMAIMSILAGGILVLAISLQYSRSALKSSLKATERLQLLNVQLDQQIREVFTLFSTPADTPNPQGTSVKLPTGQQDWHDIDLLHASRLNTLGVMSVALSHEVNQPLGAIANFAATAKHVLEKKDDAQSQSVARILAQIADQSLRCGQLIRRIREFGRKSDFEKVVCDGNSLIEDAIQLMSHEAARHRVELFAWLQAKQSKIFADPIQVQQILVNLIFNGIESISDNNSQTRQITIRTTNQDGQFCIECSDTGRGFSDSVLKTPFQPFVTTKKNGLGIGLCVCKLMTDEHGGTISARNRSEGGAILTIHLPVAVADSQEAPKRIDSAHSPSDIAALSLHQTPLLAESQTEDSHVTSDSPSESRRDG